MIHKGEELERRAEQLERQANNTLDEKQRRELRSLAADLRRQKTQWESPRG